MALGYTTPTTRGGAVLLHQSTPLHLHQVVCTADNEASCDTCGSRVFRIGVVPEDPTDESPYPVTCAVCTTARVPGLPRTAFTGDADEMAKLFVAAGKIADGHIRIVRESRAAIRRELFRLDRDAYGG